MMKIIIKLISTIKIAVYQTIIYRGNWFTSLIIGLLPLTAQIIFWTAVYSSGSSNGSSFNLKVISNYNYVQIITYFFIVYILQWGIGSTSIESKISEDVKNGEINFHLLRPYNYLVVRLIMSATSRIIILITTICIYLILLMTNFEFIIPNSIFQTVLFIISIFMSYFISFLINSIIGSIAFWTLEISTLSVLLKAVLLLTSGAVFPLDFFEGVLGKIFKFSPFAYLSFFSTQIYLYNYSNVQIVKGIIIGLIWILVLFFILSKVWKKGLEKYSAFGG